MFKYCFGSKRQTVYSGLVDQKLKLTRFEWIYIIFGTLVSYGALTADLVAAFAYTIDLQSTWWVINTLVAAFAPGVFMCIAQHFSYYQELDTFYSERERNAAAQSLAPGDRLPLVRRRKMNLRRWFWCYVYNIFQVRMIYEAVNSIKWQFTTGAYLDCRTIQVLCQSVPQLLVQSWIIFHLWGDETPFTSWVPTFVSFGFACACIALLPNQSPCFEDNFHLVTLRHKYADLDDRSNVSDDDVEHSRSHASNKESDDMSSGTESVRSFGDHRQQQTGVELDKLGSFNESNRSLRSQSSMRSLSGTSTF